MMGGANRVTSRYYPYGEEYTTTAQDTEKFATYYRDQTTALDYARNRYYSSTWGRFLTPDPYRANNGAAGDPADPGTWNRYAYAGGDPVNRVDPVGTNFALIYGGWCWGGGEEGGYYPCDIYGWNGLIGWALPSGVGGGGGGEWIIAKVPQGNHYTQAQKQALNNGLNDALTHADQMDCAHLFAAGDEDPVLATEQVLENTTYRLLPLPQGPGTAAQTADLYNVQINTAGAFFNAAPNANGTVTVSMPNTAGVQTSFTFANESTFQGFIMLHELGHQMGVFGPDTNAATNGANSQAVLDDCFKEDAHGVYH